MSMQSMPRAYKRTANGNGEPMQGHAPGKSAKRLREAFALVDATEYRKHCQRARVALSRAEYDWTKAVRLARLQRDQAERIAADAKAAREQARRLEENATRTIDDVSYF